MRVAFLGPVGTFSEEAAQTFPRLKGAERTPFASFEEVFSAAARRETDLAVLPIENSLEGAVGAAMDLLLRAGEHDLKIAGEAVLQVRHCLLASTGTTVETLAAVHSHPQALAQCSGYLARTLPGAERIAASSTAAAAAFAAKHPGTAAIASRNAASTYGLAVLAEEIQDKSDNWTRFVLLGREEAPPTGRDRTSLAFTLDRDRPGGLYQALGEFARRGLNLSRIESRPLRTALGHYRFYLDFEGHRSDPTCAEAIEGLESRADSFHLFGSYPRADS